MQSRKITISSSVRHKGGSQSYTARSAEMILLQDTHAAARRRRVWEKNSRRAEIARKSAQHENGSVQGDARLGFFLWRSKQRRRLLVPSLAMRGRAREGASFDHSEEGIRTDQNYLRLLFSSFGFCDSLLDSAGAEPRADQDEHESCGKADTEWLVQNCDAE